MKRTRKRAKLDSQAAEAIKIRHSGLTRDLKTQEKFRDAIEKFDHDVRLSNDELMLLLKFYAHAITFTDVLGQRYDLTHADLLNQHRKLVQIAAERVWTQNALNMWGKTAARVLERIS